ncbi:MAG: zinc ribbon domain-containing protein [Planctomycetes bacterium]|nr:zinc ribbon domain-containing protein [Planctomycetota bacterium]
MPIYEYDCRSCNHRFETLVREGDRPRCPSCGGGRLAKRLSTFAVEARDGRRNAAPAAARPCGTCGDPRGPGACARD